MDCLKVIGVFKIQSADDRNLYLTSIIQRVSPM